MYESPIELFSVEDYSKQIDEQIEKAVYEVITKIGINVNREELIKALEYDRNQYEKGYADGKRNGIEWIPVSDRLPEEETAVLISCEDLYLHRLNPCIGWRNGQYWNTFKANGFKQILYPIAWMPLPEPYKAENEGGKVFEYCGENDVKATEEIFNFTKDDSVIITEITEGAEDNADNS